MILLPNGGAAFRGLLKKFYDAKTNEIGPEAYLRREVHNPDGSWTRKDTHGVSVCSSKAVLQNLSLKGIAKIESSDIRAVRQKDGTPLEIFADPPASDAQHGNIVEIPYLSLDKETAERIAGELARRSELEF